MAGSQVRSFGIPGVLRNRRGFAPLCTLRKMPRIYWKSLDLSVRISNGPKLAGIDVRISRDGVFDSVRWTGTQGDCSWRGALIQPGRYRISFGTNWRILPELEPVEVDIGDGEIVVVRIGVPASSAFLEWFGEGLRLPYPNLMAT